jgi:ribosomal protein S18 acetylase RimI-like enzyme
VKKRENDLYVHNIQVEREFQRKKIGSSLMNKAFLIAKKLGCKKVVLKVLKNNLSAKNFYKKIGFSSLKQDDRSVYLEKTLEKLMPFK